MWRITIRRKYGEYMDWDSHRYSMQGTLSSAVASAERKIAVRNADTNADAAHHWYIKSIERI